jgi:hypothetical protein
MALVVAGFMFYLPFTERQLVHKRCLDAMAEMINAAGGGAA